MKIVSFAEAVGYIHDGDTLLIGGSGGGHAVPEALIVALEQRYLQEARPEPRSPCSTRSGSAITSARGSATWPTPAW